MAKRSSISPTLTVFGVWWVVTAYFSPTYEWASMVQMATIVGFGILLGGIGAVVSIAVIRTGYRTVVSPSELRGLRCSIGEVPLPMLEPARAEELPSISPVTVPDIPADFVDNWLDEYSAKFPRHAALFKALLRVLNHRPDLPATHVAGGHGGRTLLQHSMLASWVITEISKDWSYDGLRDRTGKKVLLPLRDPEYRFNPHDPMVAIIGLAHDIGKIESFLYNDRGDVVGIRSEHDLTGSRMIARMPETWEIPANDRDAMLLAIAHYHHPVELPLAPSQRKAVARDDRTIALMELLIKADFCVTSVETRGVMPTNEEYRSLEAVRSVSFEQLYDEFIALIHEAHRVNSGNIKYSVGQISPAPDGKGALLYLHEESLRLNMMRRLGLQSTNHLGDGRYQLTIDILNMLNARGLLYTTHENLEYSPGNAMWVCDVLGSKNQKVSSWPCVIAVKLDNFEKLQQLGFFSSSIKILRNRFGAHIGKPARNATADTMVLGGLGSSNDIPDAPPPTRKKVKGALSKGQNQSKHQPSPEPKTVSLAAEPEHQPQSSASVVPTTLQEPSEKVEPILGDTTVFVEGDMHSGRIEPTIVSHAETSSGAPLSDTPESDNDTSASVTVVIDDQPQAGPSEAAEAGVTPDPEVEVPASAIELAGTPAAETLTPADVDVDMVISALMLAIDQGEKNLVKCRKGNNGSIVFNLNDLLSPPSLAEPAISAPGVVDYLASGKIKGAAIVRLQSLTLVSVTPPLSSD